MCIIQERSFEEEEEEEKLINIEARSICIIG